MVIVVVECKAGMLKPLESVVVLELAGAVRLVLDCDKDFGWVSCWEVIMK